MKAVFLIRNGNPEDAFEIRDVPMPVSGDEDVKVKVTAFGLNFADVMARKGLYRDCPPLPCVIGYDAAGIVDAVGKNVTRVKVGDYVTVFTRFNGYAEYILTNQIGVAKIPANLPLSFAAALATQYCTAWYCTHEAAKVYEGENVLVNAAAGGVGSAAVQLLKLKKATVFGTCGSEEKIKFLQEIGVDYPINYNRQDYKEEIRKVLGSKKLDVVIDSVGGKYVREGMAMLGAGGRLICLGGAQLSSATGFFSKWSTIFQFGLYHPGILMMSSHSLIGVNMLKVADNKPRLFSGMLDEVISLAEKGMLKPLPGIEFAIGELAAAHAALEHRKTHGKVVIRW